MIWRKLRYYMCRARLRAYSLFWKAGIKSVDTFALVAFGFLIAMYFVLLFILAIR